MTEADAAGHLTPLQRAAQYRNGLMVALLACCPIRLKNFAALTHSRQEAGQRSCDHSTVRLCRITVLPEAKRKQPMEGPDIGWVAAILVGAVAGWLAEKIRRTNARRVPLNEIHNFISRRKRVRILGL